MRILARLLRTVLFVVAMAPSAAFAQASIAGTVRDSSGAVLPGVTVEAASPTLIEKVRTAVTDGTGQYKIENLRPGTYAVTFSLTGFSAVKRDGIELAGSFAATVNAELQGRIGRRNDHGVRRVADRGRAERKPPEGAEPGSADGPADRADAVHGRHAHPRHEPEQPGRRRHQHHQHDRRVDDDSRQQRERPARDDRRVVHGQLGTGRAGQQLPAEHGQHAGDVGRLLVRHGRSDDRRRPHQHAPARGRQHASGDRFSARVPTRTSRAAITTRV